MAVQLPAMQAPIIPSITTSERDILDAIRPGKIIAVFRNEKYYLYKLTIVQPFNLVTPVTIPANSESVTLSAQSTTIPGSTQPNPLYAIYNTPQSYKILYILGLSWNSPFVDLSAEDNAGTPYWQLTSNIQTKAYTFDRVYSPSVFLGAQSASSPTLIFNRRVNILAPYPHNLPLPFQLNWSGFLTKYSDVGEVPIDKPEELSVASLILYLFSPFPKIWSSGGT